jgi:hypothetical protein
MTGAERIHAFKQRRMKAGYVHFDVLISPETYDALRVVWRPGETWAELLQRLVENSLISEKRALDGYSVGILVFSITRSGLPKFMDIATTLPVSPVSIALRFG